MRAARQPLAEVGREGQHVDPGDPGSAPEPEDLPPAQTLIEPLEEGGRVGNPPPSSDHRHPGCTAGARSPGRPRSGRAHPGGGQVAFDLPGQRQAVRRHAAGPHDHQADGARLAGDGLAQAAVRAGPDLERLLRRRLERLLRVVDRPRDTPPVTAFWAFKLNQKLASSGLGSTRVTRDSHVLVYYTTFDPETGATQPTLGITASTRRPAGERQGHLHGQLLRRCGDGHAGRRRPGAGQRRSPRRERQRHA